MCCIPALYWSLILLHAGRLLYSDRDLLQWCGQVRWCGLVRVGKHPPDRARERSHTTGELYIAAWIEECVSICPYMVMHLCVCLGVHFLYE